MATEQGRARARDGTEAAATAEVGRYSVGRRLLRSAPLAVGGTLLGAATIVIPTVHLISTWLIPLISCGAAYYLFKVAGRVGAVRVEACAACGEPFELAEAGNLDGDPLWIRCAHCRAPSELVLGPDPVDESAG